jgi:hypothetical protein
MAVRLEIGIPVHTYGPGMLRIHTQPELSSVDLGVAPRLRHIVYSSDQGDEILWPSRTISAILGHIKVEVRNILVLERASRFLFPRCREF